MILVLVMITNVDEAWGWRVWMRCFEEMKGVAGRKVGAKFSKFSYGLATSTYVNLVRASSALGHLTEKLQGPRGCTSSWGPH